MKVIAIFEQFTYRITSLKGLEYKGEEIINGKFEFKKGGERWKRD